jgi:ADP-heptose:LPS heptosyltransferase
VFAEGHNVNEPHRFGDSLPRRIAVFRALQLGDLLCAVPALRALRGALPAAEIILIGLPWARAFAERFDGYLDGFREFPGFPGLPERSAQVAELPPFLAAMQRERFDLVIQMHGCGTIANPLMACLGARMLAGFCKPGEFCPDAQRFLPYPERAPEVWRHLRLMAFLGVPARGEDLEFPVLPRDRQALAELAEAECLRPGSYVCVHPGARGAYRRWPPGRFAAVADALAGRGLRVILTGTREEAPLTAAVAAAMSAPAADLACRTDLGTLAALLEGARLLVCNDTGVSHLAAALRTPSVVVFHAISELDGWPPLDRQRHRVVCRLGGVTPEAVLAQADDLLARTPTGSVTAAVGRPPLETPKGYKEELGHASLASADVAHPR